MISSNEDIGNYLNNSNNTFNMVVKVLHIESIGAIAKVVDRLCNDLVVRVLDAESKNPGFKNHWWLLGGSLFSICKVY